MHDDMPDADSVREALRSLSSRPVWNPPSLGRLDMEIRTDGSWWYEGSQITRQGLVRLFSRILRCRDGVHELVTPVECWEIRVEDSAFVMTEWHWDQGARERVMVCRTNTGEAFLLEHAGAFRLVVSSSGEPRPYVRLRDGLEARIPPLIYYQWLEECVLEEDEGAVRAILASAGQRFCLGEAPDSV